MVLGLLYCLIILSLSRVSRGYYTALENEIENRCGSYYGFAKNNEAGLTGVDVGSRNSEAGERLKGNKASLVEMEVRCLMSETGISNSRI